MAATMSLVPVAVIFDFDGVIIDSSEIKAEAFRRLFHDRPAHVDAIVQFHRNNAGLSRFRQFEFIHRDILNEDLTAERATAMSERLSSLVLPQLMSTGLIPGALDLLKRVQELRIPAFILSGTPEPELLQIVNARNLSALFDGVFGSPPGKVARLKELQDRFGFPASGMLYIGDAPSDGVDSAAAGVKFIGVSANGRAAFPPDTMVVSGLDQVRIPFDRGASS